jgi:acetoin:2,6-dichlorophenolindophenol oxidoreductase subunit beta
VGAAADPAPRFHEHKLHGHERACALWFCRSQGVLMPKMRMNQAISAAIADEMRDDPDVFVLGEDVADAGGVFKATEGLLEEFGPHRVRNTPISEMGFLGAAVGAAATGTRPVVEMMFLEFLGVALDQLTTQAAKFRFLSGGRLDVPMLVRGSVGAGLGFGAQHSQTLEGWVTSTPGLKVGMASGARSAYELTRAAIRDDGPVVVLEPRALYGKREDVERRAVAATDIGRAEVRRGGADATVLATGQMVNVALQAAEELSPDIDLEVIDVRWLVPWDVECVEQSVRRTGRVAVIEEAPRMGSWGNEVAAHVATSLLDAVRAPVLRVNSPDTPIPFPPGLEARWLPENEYVVTQLREWLARDAVPEPWWVASEVTR